jgi:hypothetical protein
MNGEPEPLDGWRVLETGEWIPAGREYRIGHVTHRHPSGGTVTLVGPPITDLVDMRALPDFIYYVRTEKT